MTAMQGLLVLASLAGMGLAAQERPRGDLPFRVALPTELPPHPRVFCTAADLNRIEGLLAREDAYATACREHLRATGESLLAGGGIPAGERVVAGHLRQAAQLAEAWILCRDPRFAVAAREILLETARQYPRLETTGARGRITSSTLLEGPVAVDAAMAYDLLAGTGQLSAEEREQVCRDLFRIMGVECGRKCRHMNSSNWRTWALAIIASCGFASGDLELIDEAVNGRWDPDREAYLYGFVQQLTHSIFSDGIHWERSIGYTYYMGSAFMPLLVAAENAGIGLWQASMPGIEGPFRGCAPHEEFGPPGPRRFDAFLLAPLYYAFPNGDCARIGDSGTRRLQSHPLYELAWERYRDPRFAWLIETQRARSGRSPAPPGWHLWQPAGDSTGQVVQGVGRSFGALRLQTTSANGRIALVRDVSAPRHVPVTVSAWLKAEHLERGAAHIRCNVGSAAVFTPSVREAGDWREVSVTLPAEAGETGSRRLRIHLFLEGGIGTVFWDDFQVAAGEQALNRESFDSVSPDGRALSFWNLLHGASDLTGAAFDQRQDARIGISGRHQGGCTLFPVGGFAVLRQDAADVDATAVFLNYGPYGSGHDHPDRLHISVYGLDEILCPDAGSWGYENPMHLTWANTTIAHNTVVIDGISQEPQRNATSIWAGERGDQRVQGDLRLFHAGTHLRAARATCDSAYPGYRLDRSVCLVDGTVVDVFRVTGSQPGVIDLPLHGPGTVILEPKPTAVEGNPFSERGYAHLTSLRRLQVAAGAVTEARFERAGKRLHVLQVHPEGGTLFAAQDPEGGAPDTTVLFTRRQAASTVFVTVMEPYREQSTLRQASIERGADGLVVRVMRTSGSEDRIGVPDASDGVIRLERLDAHGRKTAGETASATDRWGDAQQANGGR